MFSTKFRKQNKKIQVEYNYPMIKVVWLADGVLLIPSNVGLVNDQICRYRVCKFKLKHGPAAGLTNKKQEYFDQIDANNLVKQSGFRIKRKKNKNIFLKEEHKRNLKTYHGPHFSLDLPWHTSTKIHSIF
jgi:hypothetical protein